MKKKKISSLRNQILTHNEAFLDILIQLTDPYQESRLKFDPLKQTLNNGHLGDWLAELSKSKDLNNRILTYVPISLVSKYR